MSPFEEAAIEEAEFKLAGCSGRTERVAILEALIHKVTGQLREQRTAAENERDEQYQRHIRRIGDLESRLRETERERERLAGLLHTTRDVNLVDMTADRDSWRQQTDMARADALRLLIRSHWNDVNHTGTVDQLREASARERDEDRAALALKVWNEGFDVAERGARGLAEALREALETLERQFASLPPELSVSEAWQLAKARLECYRAALSEWEAAEARRGR